MTDPNTSAETGTIQQFYEALLRTETYSAENLTRFQDNVLKDLLPFVARHVPFYRGRLAPVLGADGSFNPENWAKLPILRAAELRNNPHAFRPIELPASHGKAVRYVSSGSTGKPTAFYRSELSEVAQNGAFYRFYRAFDLDPARNMAMIRAFDPALSRFKPVFSDSSKVPWTAPWFAKGDAGQIHILTVFTPIARQVEWLNGLGAIYLNTFPSNALAIARHVAGNPGTKPQLLAILTIGEPLTEETRRQCEEHLGCRCIDVYSSAECGLIASDCPRGAVQHVESELCRVEILDRRDKPVKQGEWGRLIVTPLYNFAMPLIRYDAGDLVRVAAPCDCGRNQQAIERSGGRPSNMFYRPRKKWFRPDLDTAMMEGFLRRNRWQLVQTGASAFELRHMPIGTDIAIDVRGFRAVLKKALGPDASVQIKPVAALGPTSAGKFLAISNRFST
ncbi:MAG: phenylacetate--CoA ligase family protein [Aestuariivirga sp.]